MLEVIKIDSLKLRIPRHKVTYVDPTFAKEYQKIYMDSGEIDEHVSLDKHKVHIENGITTRIAVFHALQGSKAEEQIVIQCNAKQLREEYFKGITPLTVITLYEYIIGLKIIHVEFKNFIRAYVSDIDLCYDVKVKPATMIEANAEIYRKVKPSCYKYVSRPFRQKGNVGIQFNLREKATPAHPYVKIYHKTLEFKCKSNEFASNFLNNTDWEDIGRLEYTIKNTRHKRHLGLAFTTLEGLFKVNLDELATHVFAGILCYIEKQTLLRETKDLSPTDRLILHFINRCISHGDDKQIIYAGLNIFEVPQERSRMKKKLVQLMEQVDDQDKLIANQETLNFLRTLRLDF